jgi:hypothetical protein
LYLVDSIGTQTSPFVMLPPFAYTSLSVSLTPGAGAIQELGFVIEGIFGGMSPSNPDFYHISVSTGPRSEAVPVPGAVSPVFAGLCAMRILLRKSV